MPTVQPGHALSKKYILIIKMVNPKNDGDGMILLVLCVCCCSLSSSSAAIGYWTGYIPGTALYKSRKINDIILEHEDNKTCDHKKITSQISKIDLKVDQVNDFLKDHYILEETNKNIEKLVKRCGFSGI